MNVKPEFDYSDQDIEKLIAKTLTSRVYDVVDQTPLELADKLSRQLQNQLYLKREDTQKVFSFKSRGAYQKMSSLSPQQLACGVVAASAGNHAQGVALAAQKLKCHANIVMPQNTPEIKVNAVRSRGAEVHLVGANYDEAFIYSQELVKNTGSVYISPYDDDEVIVGNATIAAEILRQHASHIDAIFVPVGGGGLIAGIAMLVKSLGLNTKIIGVEPIDANAMAESARQQQRIKLSHVGQFADGVAVKEVGLRTFALARRYVDGYVLVNTEEICVAISEGFAETRVVFEPSGALAIAGAKKYAAIHPELRQQIWVAIVSGANMNFARLRFVAEQAESHEVLLAATLAEKPGSFLQLCQVLGERHITEFNYRYSDHTRAHVFLGLSTAETAAEVVAHLARSGIASMDLGPNEAARFHLRHMVGGIAHLENERLFHFEFPEYHGAFLRFLQSLAGDWNISLFHYRNHGADYAKVLVGIQLPAADNSRLDQFLASLGFSYREETNNDALQIFLAKK